MLSDKGLISRTSSKAGSLKSRLPQKHLRTPSNEASIYSEEKPNNLKSTFTTLLKSVTGYFKVAPTNTNKRIRISSPTNFIHFGHAGIDPSSGEFNSYANTFAGHLPGENVEAIMSIPINQPINQYSHTSNKSSCHGSSIRSTENRIDLNAKHEKISAPLNPIHITHVSISNAGEYVGLPKDWQVAVKEPSLRY